MTLGSAGASRRSSAATTALDDPQDVQRLTLRRTPWRRNVTRFDRILDQRYEGKGTEEEPFLVSWLDWREIIRNIRVHSLRTHNSDTAHDK